MMTVDLKRRKLLLINDFLCVYSSLYSLHRIQKIKSISSTNSPKSGTNNIYKQKLFVGLFVILYYFIEIPNTNKHI